MGLGDVVHFKDKKYTQEIHEKSTEQLTDLFHKLHRSAATNGVAVGGGMGTAVVTGGVSLLVSAFSARQIVVIYEKMSIIDAELRSRGAATPHCGSEDFIRGFAKGAGNMVLSAGIGAAVGPLLGDSCRAATESVSALHEFGAHVAVDTTEDGVGDLYEHLREGKKTNEVSSQVQRSANKVEWHEHSLEYLAKVPSSDDQDWFCDVCGKHNAEASYHCEKCHYDNCPECYEAGIRDPKTLHARKPHMHVHPLEYLAKYERKKNCGSSYWFGRYVCNTCNKTCKSEGFHCEQCIYDNCPECYTGALLVDKKYSIPSHDHPVWKMTKAFTDFMLAHGAPNDGGVCDICTTNVLSGCYACVIDGFCVCADCFKKLNAKKM